MRVCLGIQYDTFWSIYKQLLNMHVYDYMFYITLNSAFTTVQARMHSKTKTGGAGRAQHLPQKQNDNIYLFSHEVNIWYST